MNDSKWIIRKIIINDFVLMNEGFLGWMGCEVFFECFLLFKNDIIKGWLVGYFIILVNLWFY